MKTRAASSIGFCFELHYISQLYSMLVISVIFVSCWKEGRLITILNIMCKGTGITYRNNKLVNSMETFLSRAVHILKEYGFMVYLKFYGKFLKSNGSNVFKCFCFLHCYPVLCILLTISSSPSQSDFKSTSRLSSMSF